MEKYEIVKLSTNNAETFSKLTEKFTAIAEEEVEIEGNTLIARVKVGSANAEVIPLSKTYPKDVIKMIISFSPEDYSMEYTLDYLGGEQSLEDIWANYEIIDEGKLDSLDKKERRELSNILSQHYKEVDGLETFSSASYTKNINNDKVDAEIETEKHAFEVSKEGLKVTINNMKKK